mmetsp:Transcript_17589/g.24169  ORF Transcript_17589/g.24169 Transcript_17589/m.24169 type:complete len:142 (-) Transcript_17589:168-593(-)
MLMFFRSAGKAATPIAVPMVRAASNATIVDNYPTAAANHSQTESSTAAANSSIVTLPPLSGKATIQLQSRWCSTQPVILSCSPLSYLNSQLSRFLIFVTHYPIIAASPTGAARISQSFRSLINSPTETANYPTAVDVNGPA